MKATIWLNRPRKLVALAGLMLAAFSSSLAGAGARSKTRNRR